MHCPLVGGDGAETIVGYVAGKLDAEANSGFRRHLGICSRCQEAVAAQEAVWSALDAWRPVPVSADFNTRVLRRITWTKPNRPSRSFDWRHGWWRPAMPVAAACVLLAGAFLMKYTAPKVAQEAQAQPKLEIEQVQHALDDMDLLRQLGVGAASNKATPAEKI